MRCNFCDREHATKITKAGNERLPRGWKRHCERIYCGNCWGERFVLRAVTFPVVGPVGNTWEEFRDALRECWQQSTRLVNWTMTELYKRDVRRAPGDAKMPSMPSCYLYPEAREHLPELVPQTVVSILNATERKYRSQRYEIVWTGARSLANARFPQPYPVHNQSWSPKFSDDNSPLVSLRLSGGRWTLQLRGGKNYRRQLAAFRKMVSGDAVRGELALYRQRANSSDHRNGTEGRENSNRQHYRVMAKLVAWLPKTVRAKPEKEKTLVVRTDKDCFLYAVIEGREKPWVLNADQVVRWQREHQRRRSRLSEDTKREKRMPKKTRERAVGSGTRRAAKYRRRIQTFAHEASAQLANFADRSGATSVKYHDSVTDYLPEFPWYEFRDKLRYKLDERNIEFEHASGSAGEKSPEPLAKSESED